MKSTFLLLVILHALILPLCAAETRNSDVIEQAIFWNAKRDSRWTPIEMSKLVGNPELFIQEGNFYKPKSKMLIFGHELVYAGILGIDLYPGPNVTLNGKIKEVKDAIEKSHNLKMKEVDGGYVADLKKDIKLLIFAHPNKSMQTIVIGAYLGP